MFTCLEVVQVCVCLRTLKNCLIAVCCFGVMHSKRFPYVYAMITLMLNDKRLGWDMGAYSSVTRFIWLHHFRKYANDTLLSYVLLLILLVNGYCLINPRVAISLRTLTHSLIAVCCFNVMYSKRSPIQLDVNGTQLMDV